MRLTIFLVLFACTGARLADVDPLKTIVWGPGLKPAEVTMRARYFFLQLVDSHGRKLVLSDNLYTNIIKQVYKNINTATIVLF